MVQKRRFDEGNDGCGQSKRKQELQIKMRDFRRAISNPALNPNVLEPFLRKVVRQEVDRALLPFFPPCPRPSLDQAGTSGVRSLHLHFVNQLPPTVYTDNRIETEDGAPIGIELIDTRSRTVVRSGPLSSLKIDIVVLDGDFGSNGQEDWTEHEFNANIQRERQGKRPLLVGDRTVTLLEGVGYIGEIHFTDNSSWGRSQKFRLGAIAAQKSSGEVKIREARSEAFRVKDHRGESNKKHKTPSLGDEIWRLNKIARDGKRHKKLVASGIQTVNDLLLQYAMNPSNIRKLFLRSSDKACESIIKQAMTCVENDDRLSTYHRAGESVSLHFNTIYQVIAATFGGQNYCTVDTLTSDQKHVVEIVKQEAYRDLNAWVPFNDMSTVSFSTPPGDAQHGPFAFVVPEQGLEFDLPVTYQDQRETWMSFNQPPYSEPHMNAAEMGNQFETSAAQDGDLMLRNTSVMEDPFFPLCNGDLCIPVTWGLGNDFLFASSNQAEHILRTAKPKVAWSMIRALFKFRAVRRLAARRMIMPIYNY